MSANFIARASGYNGNQDWLKHSKMTREHADLEDMKSWISQVADIGFEGISMHTIHCWYHDIDSEAIKKVKDLAASFALPIFSYAGEFGLPDNVETFEQFDQSDPSNWEKTFTVAKQLGCGWLSGGFGPRDNGPIIRDMCTRFGLRFAFENHPNEKSAEDILKKIDGFEEFMDVAFDTGWAGTCGFDAPATIRKLSGKICEVHLKDVREEGQHNTCALGDGIVGIEACLEALLEIGYEGWITIEHEPFDRDPMPEVRTSYGRVRNWMKRLGIA